MDRNEASALADLQMHWDEAYAIGFNGEVWSARFHGCTDELCARTNSDLRELIRADYAHRQRPSRPTQATADGNTTADASGKADDRPAAGYDEPAETEPAETEPAETEPAETEPAETDAAEDDAAEDGAAEDGASPQTGRVSDCAAEPLGSIDFTSLRGERMSM